MSEEKIPFYGGQALIEGVLMRSTQYIAAAFRLPSGEIVIKSEKLGAIYTGGLKRIPILRGLMALWDALGLGIRFLNISANLQVETEEKIEGPALYFTTALSLIFGIGLFFILPAAVTHFIEQNLSLDNFTGNLIEGIIRLGILVGYMWLIGKMPEIHRVFAYHGAEHKTINAFEAGAELTPEIVETYSLEHPRCGTSFLLTVMVLSIIVFSFFGPMDILWRLLSRVIMIPLLAGLAYEYIRWTAKYLSNPFVYWLMKPNLLLQKLTTRTPDRDMLEVAITSFKTMLKLENETPS